MLEGAQIFCNRIQLDFSPGDNALQQAFIHS
jgi:hypothetical protein